MKIHLISIGGSVMHQLAIALKQKGYDVSGADEYINTTASTALSQAGILPEKLGWFPENINKQLDKVIISMATQKDNPELIKAQKLGLQIFSVPEYFLEESINKKRIAIAGSFGKTYTSALLMHILQYCFKTFDYIVDEHLQHINNSIHLSDEAPIMLCEADECPCDALTTQSKFHFYHPHIAVITGIEWDHFDFFPNFEKYLKQFELFIQTIIPKGVLIYNALDPHLSLLIHKTKRDDIRYKPFSTPIFKVEEETSYLQIDNIQTSLKIFGNHHMLNVQAAYEVCQELGITSKEFLRYITQFNGIPKILEPINPNSNSTIYRDSAQAPKEIKATIEALKERYPQKEIHAIIELDSFSSLSFQYIERYKNIFHQCKEIAIIYDPKKLKQYQLPNLSDELIQSSIAHPNSFIFDNIQRLEKHLQQKDFSNKVVVFMGKGNFHQLNLMQFCTPPNTSANV